MIFQYIAAGFIVYLIVGILVLYFSEKKRPLETFVAAFFEYEQENQENPEIRAILSSMSLEEKESLINRYVIWSRGVIVLFWPRLVINFVKHTWFSIKDVP